MANGKNGNGGKKEEKKYKVVGKDGAFTLFTAKGIKPFKGADRIPFSFKVPTVVEFPGIPESETAFWRKMLAEGAWNAGAKLVKLENDTQVQVKGGDKVDLFSMPAKKIAKFLNSQFITLKSIAAKDSSGKVEGSRPARKLETLAAMAVRKSLVEDNGVEVDPLENDRFVAVGA